jgi:hypothetical protein
VSWQSRMAVSTILGSVMLAACSNSSTGTGTLPSCGAHGSQLSLSVGQYQSVDPASDSGCVTFAANTNPDTAEYLVLPWSNGGNVSVSTPSAPFSLQSATPAAAAMFAQIGWLQSGATFGRGGALSARGPAAIQFDRFLRESARSPQFMAAAGAALPQSGAVAQAATAGPPLVGDRRVFKVCANLTCSPPFTNVTAFAKSVGVHIAIYVDSLAPSPGLSQTDLDSLKGVFDSRLYPLDTATFGHVSDIDSNTVVIVLMTNAVNKLVTASRCNTSGYIAGFFFPADLETGAGFNNGEIFYSVVADSLGTLSCAHTASEVNDVTPVTFTHEFQHMINFVEHVLIRSGNSEDGWLDEGLSKYAEEIAGRSFGDNAHFSQFAIGDVYDGYQYLLSPQTTPLLIPQDTGSLAEVGASWLFTRYIVDRFGDSLPGKLVRTTLTGGQNVATQTGQPFDSTIAQWALTNWVANVPTFSAPTELKYTSWNFRHTFDTLFVQDPRDFPIPYPLVPAVAQDNAVNVSGTLWAGSGAYVRVMQPPNGAMFTLHFSGAGGAAISPTVVPRLNVLRIR